MSIKKTNAHVRIIHVARAGPWKLSPLLPTATAHKTAIIAPGNNHNTSRKKAMDGIIYATSALHLLAPK